MFYFILILLPAFCASTWFGYDCNTDMDGDNLRMGFQWFCKNKTHSVPHMIYDKFNACYYLENYWHDWILGRATQSKAGFAYNYRYYVHPEMKGQKAFTKAEIFAKLLSTRKNESPESTCKIFIHKPVFFCKNYPHQSLGEHIVCGFFPVGTKAPKDFLQIKVPEY